MYDDLLPVDAERIVLPGVGHIPSLDDPELVARTITDFLAKQPR
jgi:pimeloyl-ACP methyl ester carboxylesterase